MADALTDTDLETVTARLVAAIAARFPDFRTVEAYRDDQTERMPVPACLLEVTEIEAGGTDDGGTGKFPCLLRFEARIVDRARDPAFRARLRLRAANLCVWLHSTGRIPGVNSDPVQVIGAMPDDFDAANGGFAGWVVEFAVPVLLGEPQPLPGCDGLIPGSPDGVMYGIADEIGAAHVADYLPLVTR